MIFSYFIALAPNKKIRALAFVYIGALTIRMIINKPKILNQTNYEQLRESCRIDIINDATVLVFLGVILLLILIVVAKVAARYRGSLRPHA